MSALRCAGNPTVGLCGCTNSRALLQPFAGKGRDRHSFSACVPVRAKKQQQQHQGAELAQAEPSSSTSLKGSLNGVVFEPFAEVQSNISHISSTAHQQSLARHFYSTPCEAAINELINVEYNVSYVYHTISAYFDRDNVALPGLAAYFKEGSEKERGDAQKLIDFQNIRGGRVKLQSIMSTESEFDNADKGDALYTMELALSLQKLTYEKLLHLSKVAEQEQDPQMHDFVDGTLLPYQVGVIKEVADYVAQLRRVGKGHGVYHFDLELQG